LGQGREATYVFHSCKRVIPLMVGGATVNLASIAALPRG